ncbi:MAG TPA: FHA domain-containing protein [bacterium]|nr:FHA domain-containing protein [bacterium]HQI49715.1 FHA domain-containing protein [bacterium]HQJ65659.1 FHA domain-containing protein [bacterium]
MVCKSCNKENPAGMRFCKYCGKALGDALRTCANGHNYDSALSRCPYCPEADSGRTLVETNDKRTLLERNDAESPGPTHSDTVIDPFTPANPRGTIRGDRTVIDNAGPTLVRRDGMGGRPDKTVIMDSPSALGPAGGPSMQSAHKLVGWLVTYDLQPSGTDFRVVEGRNKIGKSASNDIVIDRPGVSEEHCLLLFRDNKFYLQDQLSTNGTFVNGTSIEDKVTLQENDVLKVGSVALKFKVVGPF